ncbi:MAG: type IV pilin N-terminal domain-containing protein [Methanoregula sp.]|nr:type IV pilin N-terminal domain-containing protein [Methanoregula sp.]
MHYLKRRTRKNGDAGVSPVVGVMLMLVVTIIIAAVVSGFAGGLVGGSNQKVPTLAMNVKIINMGSWVGSGFFATVTGVSDPIQTKDLKISTTWSTTKKYDPGYPSNTSAGMTTNGSTFTGGSTCVPLSSNVNRMANSAYTVTAPLGFGAGVNGSATISDTNPTKPTSLQNFGNYSIASGTTMYGVPCGAASWAWVGGQAGATSSTTGYGVSNPYTYTSDVISNGYVDPTQAILGTGWENLRAGDIVNVRVIHIPSGKVIFNKDVVVTES